MRQVVLDQLDGLGLKDMRRELERQSASPAHKDRSFEDRLSELLEFERVARDDRRLKERLRKAGLRQGARLEELESASARGIDRTTLEFLGRGTWVKERRNLAVTGACGVGKTFVACALAHRVCDLKFSARYCRLPRLLHELEVARADGSYLSRLASLARIDLLVLDDWGIAPMESPAKRDLLELLDDRYQKRSTLVAAQLPVELWHDWIADPPLADAILDRLVHNAYRLELKGDSQRKARGILPEDRGGNLDPLNR
ncbi:MAG: ATP-binding protein [Acidobacteria bacterium]|nr:ATP-binding protein [Acidobacteriota bacterium]